MTVYISGPITGRKDYMKRFRKAERVLKKLKLDVVNPAKVNSNLPLNSSYEFYMDTSIAMLKNCDVIYMLKGWEYSNGAKIEHTYATKNNKIIFYESDFKLYGCNTLRSQLKNLINTYITI